MGDEGEENGDWFAPVYCSAIQQSVVARPVISVAYTLNIDTPVEHIAPWSRSVYLISA